MLLINQRGIIIDAEDCVILKDDALTPEEWDKFPQIEHRDIHELCNRGVSVTATETLVEEIAALLRINGPDTAEQIAAAVKAERPDLL